MSLLETFQQGCCLYQEASFSKTDTPYKETEFPFGDTTYKLITKEDKIVLPAVKYYHKTLCHPGESLTELTMAQHFTWKGMQNTV
jgi:hypothetical protein